MKCNAIDCNTVKKAYNSPDLVELDISKTAAGNANHNESPDHHRPKEKDHHGGRHS